MPSSPTTPSGSSTVRNRSNRPPPLEHTESHLSNTSSANGNNTSQSTAREDDPKSSGSGTSTNVQFPGGLYLPAVKGTIGGIESPRRHIRSAPSISTLRGDLSSNSTSFPSDSASTIQASQNPEEQEEPPAPPPASRAVFRSDPTIKSCITGLKIERADEIARLFGVA